MSAPFLDLVRHSVTAADRDAFYRRIDDGSMTRVIRGVAVNSELWEGADAAQRHRILVHAALATTNQRVAVAGASAVVLYGLPWIGGLPPYAEVVPLGDGGRSSRTIRVTGDRPRATTLIDGVPTVELGRALADVARSLEFHRAVVVADAAASLRAAVLDEARAEIARVPGHRGGTRALAALDFADARSESPGESLSRASMERMRLPRPVLQAEFPRSGGGTWRVDFWWPDFGVIGEFDGRVKYLGEDAARVVLAEKQREDELRSHARSFVRWGWETASSPTALGRLLSSVGLRTSRSSADRRYGPAVGRKIGS